MLYLVLVVATVSVSEYIASNGRMRNCEGSERKRSYANVVTRDFSGGNEENSGKSVVIGGFLAEI
jgi:hypothetical protein